MIPGPHLQIFAQDQLGDREWFLGPFQKQLAVNPILSPSPSSTFFCPVQKDSVNWERRHLFNPGAVVRKGKVFLLYRAEDGFWESGSTSRIGLAWSEDGMHFQRRPEPVLYPDGGSATRYEWPGGCEDPRVVETEAGLYVLTYTAWNRKTARLSVATSYDLIHWSKHGLAFGKSFNGRYRDFWSKSGSIICGNKENHFVPEQINGHYWMYWGDSNIYLAWSDDLINWTPIERPGLPSDDGALMGEALRDRLLPVLSVRNGYFDSQLVEPGPPAVMTGHGIVLIYNGCAGAGVGLPRGTYATGQALFSAADPGRLIDRGETYFLKPDQDYEISGQVSNVCFVEGLVIFKGRLLLYYGTADSRVAVAAGDLNAKSVK